MNNFRINTRKQPKVKSCPICSGPIRYSFQRECNDCKAKLLKGAFSESDNLYGLSHPIASTAAKNACHAYIRERDSKEGCCSCDTPADQKGVVWQAGHLFSAGQFSGVEFDEGNIFRQCYSCNSMKDGNFQEYKTRFIRKYGQLEFDLLETRANATRLFKRSVPELVGIIREYNTKLEDLKASLHSGK